MIKEVLRNIGFSEKEIIIYLTLLPLGRSTATIISKRTDINRNTVQYTCQQLLKRNIITVVENNNTFYYSPESPQKIIHNLQIQKEIIDAKLTKTRRIISQLENMIHPESALPKVRFYEGENGIKEGFVSFLEEIEVGSEIINFTKAFETEDIKHEYYPMFQKHFIKKRVEKKISIRVIATHTDESIKHQKLDKKHLRQTRIINTEDLDFIFGEFFIFNDKLYAVSIEKNDILFSYTVESSSITAMYRALFEFAWKQAAHK